MVEHTVVVGGKQVTLSFPENVEEAKALGMDVDMVISLGAFSLAEASILNFTMSGEPGASIIRKLMAGAWNPTPAAALYTRLQAMEEKDQKEFFSLLLSRLDPDNIKEPQ